MELSVNEPKLTNALDKAQKEVANAIAPNLFTPTKQTFLQEHKNHLIIASPYVAVGVFCYFKKYSFTKSAIVTLVGGSIIYTAAILALTGNWQSNGSHKQPNVLMY